MNLLFFLLHNLSTTQRKGACRGQRVFCRRNCEKITADPTLLKPGNGSVPQGLSELERIS